MKKEIVGVSPRARNQGDDRNQNPPQARLPDEQWDTDQGEEKWKVAADQIPLVQLGHQPRFMDPLEVVRLLSGTSHGTVRVRFTLAGESWWAQAREKVAISVTISAIFSDSSFSFADSSLQWARE